MLPPLPVAKAPLAVPDTKDVKVLAKAYAPEALRTLYEIGTDPEAKHAARVSALNSILDQAKDTQEGSGNFTVIINQINAALAKTPTPTTVDITSNVTP